MRSLRIAIANRLEKPLGLDRWIKYKEYKHQVLRETGLIMPRLNEGERKFKKLIIDNKLTIEELKCIIALVRTRKYTTNEIARIFIWKDR